MRSANNVWPPGVTNDFLLGFLLIWSFRPNVVELILVIFVLFIGKLMAPITDATEALLISQISLCPAPAI